MPVLRSASRRAREAQGSPPVAAEAPEAAAPAPAPPPAETRRRATRAAARAEEIRPAAVVAGEGSGDGDEGERGMGDPDSADKLADDDGSPPVPDMVSFFCTMFSYACCAWILLSSEMVH
jgi:hypothetical protein